VFLFLILGAFDLGRAVILNNSVGEGARDGARTAQVLIRQNHYSFTSVENTQIRSAAIKPISAASGSSASAPPPVASTDPNGYWYVTVSVTATYQPVIGTFIRSLRTKTFQGTSTLAVPCGKC
jgi:Flp pilus assembly protein TadG